MPKRASISRIKGQTLTLREKLKGKKEIKRSKNVKLPKTKEVKRAIRGQTLLEPKEQRVFGTQRAFESNIGG